LRFDTKFYFRGVRLPGRKCIVNIRRCLLKEVLFFKAQILKNRSGFVMKSTWGERWWWQTHDYQKTIPSTYRKGQWVGWGEM